MYPVVQDHIIKRGFSDGTLVRFPPNLQGSAWIKVELLRVFPTGLLMCLLTQRRLHGDTNPGKSVY